MARHSGDAGKREALAQSRPTPEPETSRDNLIPAILLPRQPQLRIRREDEQGTDFVETNA